MEIKKFKLLGLRQTGEAELSAELEIDKNIKGVSIDFQKFEDDFYGFHLPEDVNVVLRNYPQLSQKLLAALSDFLKQRKLDLPVDFSLIVRRQNVAARQSEKLAA
jgi:hypothetical protein